ncbi:MAG: hypothetical protein AAGU74_06350, partial [Bacillota bacterium]
PTSIMIAWPPLWITKALFNSRSNRASLNSFFLLYFSLTGSREGAAFCFFRGSMTGIYAPALCRREPRIAAFFISKRDLRGRTTAICYKKIYFLIIPLNYSVVLYNAALNCFQNYDKITKYLKVIAIM